MYIYILHMYIKCKRTVKTKTVACLIIMFLTVNSINNSKYNRACCTDGERERQIQREKERYKERERERYTERERERDRQTETERETERVTERERNRERETDREMNRERDKERLKKKLGIEKEREIYVVCRW